MNPGLRAIGCGLLLPALLITGPAAAWAAGSAGLDAGYRYNHLTGACANERGETGRSRLFPGVCGDYHGISMTVMVLSGAMLMGLDAGGGNHGTEHDRTAFTAADLRGASFAGATLYTVEFTEANLQKADFRGANLTARGNWPGSAFVRADLRGADFRRASIIMADYTGADLRGADFRDAYIDPTGKISWDGAVYDRFTRLPFPASVAAVLGMVEDEAPAEDIEDKYEPAWARHPQLIAHGACGLTGDLAARMAECATVYGDDAGRSVLHSMGLNEWRLASVSDRGAYLWISLTDDRYWVDLPEERPADFETATERCASLAQLGWPAPERPALPTLEDLADAIKAGLLQGLPTLDHPGQPVWTGAAYNHALVHTLLPRAGGMIYYDHRDQPNRFVCFAGQR